MLSVDGVRWTMAECKNGWTMAEHGLKMTLIDRERQQ